MPEFNPKPYEYVKHQYFTEAVTIKLRNEDFEGVAVKSGKIAVNYGFCFFTKLIILSEEEINFEQVSVSFNNCLIEDLLVEKIISKNVTINFHASMIAGRISATNLVNVGVNNCLLENDLFLFGMSNIDISYTTENFLPYRWRHLIVKRGITNLKLLFATDQRYHIVNSKKINIHSSKKSTDMSEIYLTDTNTKAKFSKWCKLGEEALLKINLSVQYDIAGLDEQTLIYNVDFQSLAFRGNPAGKVSVENTTICDWYLSEFSPKEEANFYNITPKKFHNKETKIGIHRCNLDKAWFDNVYFGDFDRLSFYRSKFSNAVFTSCNFPESYTAYEKFTPIANIHYPKNRTTNHHKDQYEIFLQLKKALEATGNIYESLKLQAISQTALKNIKSIAPADKFILSLNRISNNHGLSISRPFVGFVIVTVIFYLLFLWSGGLLYQPNCVFDPNLIGYYFSFIDITHRSDFLLAKQANLNGFSFFFDYINKVLMGYLIFQFISSFRKYGKR